MKQKWLKTGLILALAWLMGVGTWAAEIKVYAAASLTDVLKRIATEYEKSTGDKIVFNFAASSVLARQIEEGAPADIFFSADEAQMDSLEKKGLLLAGSRRSRLSNQLVIVVAKEGAPSIASPKDLAAPAVKKIALGDPKAVPAGVYAKEYLEKLNLWEIIKPKVVPTENVRAALAAVESGNVEAAMVYKTDATQSQKVTIAYEVPLADGPKISYPAAIIKDSKQAGPAGSFLSHLDSPEAAREFEKSGFILLKQEARTFHVP